MVGIELVVEVGMNVMLVMIVVTEIDGIGEQENIGMIVVHETVKSVDSEMVEYIEFEMVDMDDMVDMVEMVEKKKNGMAAVSDMVVDKTKVVVVDWFVVAFAVYGIPGAPNDIENFVCD